MTEQVHIVLEALDKFKPFNASTLKTQFERASGLVSATLLVVAGILFVVASGFALWQKLGHSLTDNARLAGVIFALLSMAVATVAMLVHTSGSLVTLIQSRRLALKRLLGELEHDAAHMRSLTRYKTSALEQADEFLSGIIERRRLYVTALTGAPESLTIFSVVAMGWSVYKETACGGTEHLPAAIYFGIAFLSGMALGAITQSAVLRRYAYQRSLLQHALRAIKGAPAKDTP